MPDHMLNLHARSLALIVGLALAGLPVASWAQDPKPKPANGTVSQPQPKPPADADDPGTNRPGDKVMKVQTESEKVENEKEKAKPATGGNPPKPASSP
jgi:hypothetical protein